MKFVFVYTYLAFSGKKRMDSPVATNSAKDVIVKMSVNRNEMKSFWVVSFRFKSNIHFKKGV